MTSAAVRSAFPASVSEEGEEPKFESRPISAIQNDQTLAEWYKTVGWKGDVYRSRSQTGVVTYSWLLNAILTPKFLPQHLPVRCQSCVQDSSSGEISITLQKESGRPVRFHGYADDFIRISKNLGAPPPSRRV